MLISGSGTYVPSLLGMRCITTCSSRIERCSCVRPARTRHPRAKPPEGPASTGSRRADQRERIRKPEPQIRGQVEFWNPARRNLAVCSSRRTRGVGRGATSLMHRGWSRWASGCSRCQCGSGDDPATAPTSLGRQLTTNSAGRSRTGDSEDGDEVQARPDIGRGLEMAGQ
jgi:hypothetical protein